MISGLTVDPKEVWRREPDWEGPAGGRGGAARARSVHLCVGLPPLPLTGGEKALVGRAEGELPKARISLLSTVGGALGPHLLPSPRPEFLVPGIGQPSSTSDMS